MSAGYLANSFDLINVRDLDLIDQARRFCSRLVIGVYTDDYAELVLGRRPVVPFSERSILVSHMRGVDEVVAHDGTDDGSDRGGVVFSVAGDPVVAVPRDAVLLTPRRQSASAVLRDALEPVTEEPVARDEVA